MGDRALLNKFNVRGKSARLGHVRWYLHGNHLSSFQGFLGGAGFHPSTVCGSAIKVNLAGPGAGALGRQGVDPGPSASPRLGLRGWRAPRLRSDPDESGFHQKGIR